MFLNIYYYFTLINTLEILLENYCKAKMIITTRLHCALPCISFGTDCIFIHKNYYVDGRFKGLESILNGDDKYHEVLCGNDEFLHGIRTFFEKYEL